MTTAATPPEQVSEQPSVGVLLADVTRDISDLMRQELELAKAEARQSATRAGAGAGMLGGAAVAGHFVLVRSCGCGAVGDRRWRAGSAGA